MPIIGCYGLGFDIFPYIQFPGIAIFLLYYHHATFLIDIYRFFDIKNLRKCQNMFAKI